MLRIKKGLALCMSLVMLGNLKSCGALQESAERKVEQLLETMSNEEKEEPSLAENDLAYGIYFNHIGLVKEAVEEGEGVDINHFAKARKDDGEMFDNSLSYASSCGSEEVFYYLLEQGASLEELNIDGENAGTQLSHYFYRYQERYLNMLLQENYDFSLRDEYGQNALDVILSNKWNYDERTWNMAQILIEHGAEITSKSVESMFGGGDRGNSNFPKIVQYLVDNGEDTGLKEIFEKAILSDSETVQKLIPKIKFMKEDDLQELGYLIVAYCNTDTLELFLEKKDSVDWNQTMMLRAAARAGNLESLKYMMEEQGFVENFENDRTPTAMEQAESNGHYEVVDYLIGQGCPIPSDTGWKGWWGNLPTVNIINGNRERLEYCLENNMGIPEDFEDLLETALLVQDYEVYKYLYTYAENHGIEMDSRELLYDCARDPEMMRYIFEHREVKTEVVSDVLNSLVDYYDAEVVRILLEEGADPNYGDTPTEVMHSDDIEKIKLLVEYGMNVNYEVDGLGLLDLAAQYSNEVLNYLLEQGIDFSKGSPNETALLLAVSNGRVQNMKDLIAAGIDLDVKNDEGMTAYEVAKAIELEEVIAVFEEIGEKTEE